mmetsp:Transcript_5029/g.12945  ORF Transcript_5029/g.12945 Transcript_5029/m.12945 type:complete len:206 (+) Transcript_5029:392-1009(+)
MVVVYCSLPSAAVPTAGSSSASAGRRVYGACSTDTKKPAAAIALIIQNAGRKQRAPAHEALGPTAAAAWYRAAPESLAARPASPAVAASTPSSTPNAGSGYDSARMACALPHAPPYANGASTASANTGPSLATAGAAGSSCVVPVPSVSTCPYVRAARPRDTALSASAAVSQYPRRMCGRASANHAAHSRPAPLEMGMRAAAAVD